MLGIEEGLGPFGFIVVGGGVSEVGFDGEGEGDGGGVGELDARFGGAGGLGAEAFWICGEGWKVRLG